MPNRLIPNNEKRAPTKELIEAFAHYTPAELILKPFIDCLYKMLDETNAIAGERIDRDVIGMVMDDGGPL